MAETVSVSGIDPVRRAERGPGFLARLWKAWRELWANEEELPVNVAELMSRPAVACSAVDNLSDAAQLMWDHDCGLVLVTDDRQHLVGVITDRDICMATYTRGRAPASIAVSEVMARDVASVPVSASVEDAAQIMAERQVRRLPVLSADEELVGVIAINDLVDDVWRRSAPARYARIVNTLAAIGRHRDLAVTKESEAA